ncbi:hypothetical protein X975_20588, partial [Stegodyphus mimosarum]
MATLVKSINFALYSRALAFRLKKAYDCHSVRTLRCFTQTHFQLSNRRYAEKHEWIVTDGKIGTVGVSHYAQEALGDVVYVQLPDIGQTVEKDGEAGVVESVKAVNELYSPVSGTITEVNEKLTEKPSLINESCYDEGWVFKIELSDLKELDTLMDEESYEKYLKSIH